jgi:hypothetical protein
MSRLNKHGSLVRSLKASAVAADLMMQQLARSKGLSAAKRVVFN